MKSELTIGKTTYQVTCKDTDADSHKVQVSYELTGPRGASYGLIRNKFRPHLLFAFNNRDFTKSTPFDDKWFTDEGRELRYLG